MASKNLTRRRDVRNFSIFAEYPDMTAPTAAVQTSRKNRRALFGLLALALAVALSLHSAPAAAMEGSAQNPDGSWSGPNGEDLGGGDPNYEPAPENDTRATPEEMAARERNGVASTECTTPTSKRPTDYPADAKTWPCRNFSPLADDANG